MAARIVVLAVFVAALVLATGFWSESGWVIALGMVMMAFTVVVALAWPNHNPMVPQPDQSPSIPKEQVDWGATRAPLGFSVGVFAASSILITGFWIEQGWVIAVGMSGIAFAVVVGLATSKTN